MGIPHRKIRKAIAYMTFGFHIIKKPIKYTMQKEYWHNKLKDLTMFEALVYLSYQVYSLRAIAKYFKKSHTYISQVYSRAYNKIHSKEK